MPIDTKHPEYEKREQDWLSIRDALEGERVVKSRRTMYLPAPPGIDAPPIELLASGKRTSTDKYDFYLSFAEFPEITKPALTGFQGIIHARPAKIQLPSKLEYLRDSSTPDDEDIEVLWGRVTEEVISGGRIGLLADISNDDKIRLVSYSAESITNWQASPKRAGGSPEFVVLREVRSASKEGDDFSLVDRDYWRELRIVDGVYKTRLWRRVEKDIPDDLETVERGDFEVVLIDGDEWVTVTMFGKSFDFIPFVSINSLDTGFDYDAVPLLPMVRRVYSIYRLTADYRRALYLKSDPQPYITGVKKEEAPQKIGGDRLWRFDNPEARVGYLDIEGDGIPLMRQAIQDELQRFDEEGGRLLSSVSRPESGDALRRRLQAHQVTLRNIVINCGRGMHEVLKVVAFMTRVVDPKSVSFDPDLNFAEPDMTGKDALEWSQAKSMGFPVSDRTLHELAVRGGVTSRSFEEEVDEIQQNSTDLVAIPRVSERPGSEPDETQDAEGVGVEDETAAA